MAEILYNPSSFSRKFHDGGLTGSLITEFREVIYRHYEDAGRDLPWRLTNNPYEILVSEIMLQQTQVERVLTKYGPFLKRFPGFPDLARAPLRDILLAWQSLGFNRRAQALQGIAQRVVAEFDGHLPPDRGILESLPGIGAATAGALMAFAFEQPVVFLETNIRRVYLYFFHPEEESVPDKMLLPLIMLTMDAQRVRSWYYALMDFGAMLKKMVSNPHRRSAHYTRQSPFPGSDREIRSRILRMFLNVPELPEKAILANLAEETTRIKRILRQLIQENFLHYTQGQYRLATGLETITPSS
jgi:A/G-specific adenine glycosylase